MNIPHRYFIYFHHYEFPRIHRFTFWTQKHGKQAMDKETYQFIYIQFNGHAYKNRHRCYSRDELLPARKNTSWILREQEVLLVYFRWIFTRGWHVNFLIQGVDFCPCDNFHKGGTFEIALKSETKEIVVFTEIHVLYYMRSTNVCWVTGTNSVRLLGARRLSIVFVLTANIEWNGNDNC